MGESRNAPFLRHSISSDYNLGQSMWNQVKKSTKIGQDLKALRSVFALFSARFICVGLPHKTPPPTTPCSRKGRSEKVKNNSDF